MKKGKPVGRTGPLSFGPRGVERHYIDFPTAKEDIEAFIAQLFCAGKTHDRIAEC